MSDQITNLPGQIIDSIVVDHKKCNILLQLLQQFNTPNSCYNNSSLPTAAPKASPTTVATANPTAVPTAIPTAATTVASSC